MMTPVPSEIKNDERRFIQHESLGVNQISSQRNALVEEWCIVLTQHFSPGQQTEICQHYKPQDEQKRKIRRDGEPVSAVFRPCS